VKAGDLLFYFVGEYLVGPGMSYLGFNFTPLDTSKSEVCL